MNKKLTNVLRTNVTLYFICLVLFALAAIPFDVRLAIGEGAAAVLLLIIARRRSRSVQQSMRQYMDRFTGGMDSARSSNMLFAPLPMMVFDADTQAVVWCNDGFLELTEQKEGVFDAHLNAVVPSFSVRWLLEGKNECPENVVWNHRIVSGVRRPDPPHSGHPFHYGHDLLDGRYRFRAAAPDLADDPACGGHPDGGQL